MDSSVREKQSTCTSIQWHVSWFCRRVGCLSCSYPKFWVAVCVLLIWLPWKYLVCIMANKSKIYFLLLVSNGKEKLKTCFQCFRLQNIKFNWLKLIFRCCAMWVNSNFLSQAYSSPKEDPELSTEEKRFILGGSIPKEPVSVIPWKLILSKAPVWALIISHFCHNWGTFILLTWMPTYYNQVLDPLLQFGEIHKYLHMRNIHNYSIIYMDTSTLTYRFRNNFFTWDKFHQH